MSEGLEKLRALGAQKIHEDTHIPLQKIQSLLQKKYDKFHKVQLGGFFSILEREYNIKLTTLREESREYFLQASEEKVDKGIFVTPESDKSSNKSLYIIIAIVLFVGVLFFNMTSTDSNSENIEAPDDTLIETVTQNIEPKKNREVDNNSSKNLQSPATEELNETIEVQEEIVLDEEITPEKIVKKAFKVVAKTKVWAGYIETKANKKYQKTFKGEVELDPSKSWLLVFGHPQVDFYVDGVKVEFKSKKNKRFFYNNGKIRSVTAKEFKRLNRGRRW